MSIHTPGERDLRLHPSLDGGDHRPAVLADTWLGLAQRAGFLFNLHLDKP